MMKILYFFSEILYIFVLELQVPESSLQVENHISSQKKTSVLQTISDLSTQFDPSIVPATTRARLPLLIREKYPP